MTTQQRIAPIIAASLVCGWSAAQAGLIHRYNFNETSGTTVHDLVGTANGEIKGNGGGFTGTGLLQLPGGTGSAEPAATIAGYVDLPNHIINVLNKITIETWVTWDSVSAWQRIFDFGTSQGGEDISDGNGNYIFLSPAGDANLRFAFRDPATGNELTQLTAPKPLETATPICITVTYDPAANTARMYSNAVLLVTGPAAIPLQNINDVNNWLGRSQWNDAMFAGSYDEFRIYDNALSPLEVAASYVSGTETPSTDPSKLGALQAVHLTVPKASMVETDVQSTSAAADYANYAGLSLKFVDGASITSDNTTVLTVAADGQITAVKAGTANVILNYGGKTDSVAVQVLPRQTGVPVVAGTLVVDLRAADVAQSTTSWPNRAIAGGAGDFSAEGAPTYVANVNNTGVAGVQFSGSDDFLGPAAPADITGSSDCSIEVWAYNPAIAAEETLVAWSRRGGPDGSNMSFNYGSNGDYGAVGHWGSPDMGWSGNVPKAGQWHYLVYTYDGVNTAKVFADGLVRTTETMTLATHPDFNIRVGAQSDTSGTAADFGQALTGFIAMVRVHTGKLTEADVANNFLFGPTLTSPGQLQTVTLGADRTTLVGARDFGTASVTADFANLHGVSVTGFATLESTDPTVVTVAASGIYTAIKVGTADIKATYQGVTVTKTITVVNPPGLELKHRYSFNEAPGATTVKDSVGTADGTVKGLGADFDGTGKLVLPGGGNSNAGADVISGYVDLPNGIINVLANISIEAWVTWDSDPSSWQRIFDFGTSDGGEDVSNGNGNYLFMSPQGDTNLRFAVRDPRTGGEPTQLTAPSPLTKGQPVYVAVSYDYNNNTAVLYRDAVAVRSGPAAVPLHIINDVNNWLGRAQWGDPMFKGSFDEFRIWEGPLTADQVASHFALGPNSLQSATPPDLGFALSAGKIVISWPSTASGFVLESTPSLTKPTSWSTVDTSAAVEQNGTKRLSLPASAAAQYYRTRN